MSRAGDDLETAEALIREWRDLSPEQYRALWGDESQRFKLSDAYDLLLTHMLKLVRDDVGADVEEVVLDLMNHGENTVGYEWLMDELIHREIELQPAIWELYLRLADLFDYHNRYDWNHQRPTFSAVATGTVDK